MTDREKYKRVFSKLHTSENFCVEVENMKDKKKIVMGKGMAACLAVVLVLGSGTAAYAADLGGIQEKVAIWFQGEQVEMEVEECDEIDGYQYIYQNEDGTESEMTLTGIMDENGTTRRMTSDELVEEYNENVHIVDDEKGRTWVYYYDQKVDITDQLNENNNLCLLSLVHDEETMYLTIEKTGDSYGWIQSDDGFSELDSSYSQNQAAALEVDVREDDNGHVWLTYHDQNVDISDQFDKDNFCRVSLEDNGETIYFTIEKIGNTAYTCSSSYDGFTH